MNGLICFVLALLSLPAILAGVWVSVAYCFLCRMAEVEI